MATAPMRLCGCGKKVPGGKMCACQIAKRAAKEKQRPSARQRGYDSRWEKARATFLSKPENRLCVYCGDPANFVDHKIAHKGDKKLFWDTKNWVPSCRRCNAVKNIKYEGGFGNPIREFNP